MNTDAESAPSLDPILRPRSIAVIGASRRTGSIGNTVLRHLIQAGFTGPVYPVNPQATSVASVPAFPSVASLPTVPDLAIIVVPGRFVLDTARDCAQKGVRGLVVITAGFREVGGAGAAAEKELLALIREYGMRMVGPNCMGVLNSSESVSMNGTFSPVLPPHGNIAFASQSGAMGMTILDYASEVGIGISQFVSLGNKADVSGNDLIAHWRDDPEVGVILLYLESFGAPRRFTQLARETTRSGKPILAVKAGRTAAGARAATSHTGALAQVDLATDALFNQCGVQRADTIEQLFDAAVAFSRAPLPKGNRVAILTNAGGPGILIADACEAHGLKVGDLTSETRDALKAILAEEASVANPIDMIASATPEQIEQSLRIVLSDPGVDAVIASYVPLALEAPLVARAFEVGARGSDKPVLAVLMSKRGLPQGVAELEGSRIPAYRFPESAARALGALWRQQQWMARPSEECQTFDVNQEDAATIIVSAIAAGREHLSLPEGLQVLEAYGIRTARWTIAQTVDEAVAAAESFGGAVVLKAASAEILHKSESGAVRLGLVGAEAVAGAFHDLESLLKDTSENALSEGVLVQEMVDGGRETIVGMAWQPQFGPILMFGLGGVHVEVLKDVSFRIQPVTAHDAAEMIDSLRGAPILEGVRGEPPVDRSRIEETIQRVSLLVGNHPEIQELDINPFLAFPDPDRCCAVDARFRLRLSREGIGDD
jgi:acetyltransferase